ncbi:hypothetical protein M378DRAFT_170158, partial [Amanita muscaria Koide BX008]
MILDSRPYLVATILQAFLYVLYLVSFVHVIRRLLYEEEGWTLRSQDQVNWALLTITSLVFVFTTVDLAFEINILLTSVDDRVISQQLIIASIAIESATLVITDAVLVRKSKTLNSVERENLTQLRFLTDHSVLVGIPEVVARRLLSPDLMACKHHMYDLFDSQLYFVCVRERGAISPTGEDLLAIVLLLQLCNEFLCHKCYRLSSVARRKNK